MLLVIHASDSMNYLLQTTGVDVCVKTVHLPDTDATVVWACVFLLSVSELACVTALMIHAGAVHSRLCRKGGVLRLCATVCKCSTFKTSAVVQGVAREASHV